MVLGLTFKENCPDIRNTKVLDILAALQEYDIRADVVDPWADRDQVRREYGLELTDLADVRDADCIIHAVAHRQFREAGPDVLFRLFRPGSSVGRVLIDIKGEWPVKMLQDLGVTWWRM